MKIGVVIGRFQAQHLTESHKQLLNESLKRNDRLMVFVGRSDVRNTGRHPLPFESVRLMVGEHLVFADNKKEFIIENLPDHPSDEYWSEVLDQKIRQNMGVDKAEVTLYGGRDSFIPYYHGDFPTEELDIGIKGESATDLRKEATWPSTEEAREGMIYAANWRFPAVYPVVDGIVVDKDNRYLLAHKKGVDGWQFFGGFVDPADENLEVAVAREVKEEANIDILPQYLTSLRIDDDRYGKERDAMMTNVFLCRNIKGTPKPGDDVDEVGWFTFDELPKLIDNHQTIFDEVKDALPRS